MIVNKIFTKKNRRTGEFYQTRKTVEYNAAVILSMERMMPDVNRAVNTEENLCLKLFGSGQYTSYRLLSNYFEPSGERFTGIHRIRRFTDKGEPIIAPNTGINFGEQEIKTLFRWFPAFKQMLLDAQKLGLRG